MVVSKRCKVCAVLDSNNVSIIGEYFNKNIPEIILKISGVELDSRKANGVLICQSCIIQLVHTDIIIDKLRNAVQRLKKTVKASTPKTVLNKSSKNVELQFENLDANKSFKETKPNTEEKVNTTKKIVRRKSVSIQEKCQNGEDLTVGTTLKKAIKRKTSPDAKLSSTIGENHRNEEDLILDTPVKKVGRRKSLFPDEKIDLIDGSDHNEVTSVKESTKKLPGTKRKSLSSTNNNGLSTDFDTTSEKGSKTVSTEESAMDLTVIEQDAGDTNIESGTEHSEKKARNCILCSKMFNSKQTLREHIEISHMGEQLKSCPRCHSEFRSQQKYDSHISGEKCNSSKHPCKYLNCSKRFKSVHKMELHIQQKHLSQKDSE